MTANVPAIILGIKNLPPGGPPEAARAAGPGGPPEAIFCCLTFDL